MPNLYLQQADGTPVATFKLYNDFTARTGQEEVTILGIIPEAVSAVPVPAGSYTRTDEPNGTPDCEDEHGEYVCTREDGHPGPHIAATVVLNNSVGAVWGLGSYTRTDELASLRLAAEQIAEAEAEATAAVTAREKAEQERDVLAERVRDLADSIRLEQATTDRLRAEQLRPLTPDMVDDAMRERAAAVYGEVFRQFGPGAALDAALLAALNPPIRPEGAEELDYLVDRSIRGCSDITSPKTVRKIANGLAEQGVRAPEVES